MQYKVLPLFYAANENFKNTIRFSVELIDNIEYHALVYAVQQVKERYPYFSVQVRKQNEEYVLETNLQPFVISEGNTAVCLNSAESNGHLLAFAYANNVISIDVSHFICDGNGIAPLVKTLLYYYILKRYGDQAIDTSTINLITDPVREGEYQYPFPEAPLPCEDSIPYQPDIENAFVFEPSYFEDDDAYAYHLRMKQSDLMKFAKDHDGSPVSLISVMLYKAVMKEFPENRKDVVFEIPHDFRKALNRPLSHDCLATVMFAKLSPEDRDADIEKLNTMIRGQMVLGCDISQDLQAINGMVQLGAYLQTMPLDVKKQTMQGIIASTLSTRTFGVSYTGNIPWGGMEKYIVDVHPYAGEKKFTSELSIEIFTLGDYFSLCVFQPGKNPAYIQQLIQCFEDIGVACTLTGEERYQLPDYQLPE